MIPCHARLWVWHISFLKLVYFYQATLNEMTTEIKKLNANDTGMFMQLIQLFAYVFEMQNFTMPEETYLMRLLQDDGFFVFVAVHEGRVTGGLTAYLMHQYYSTAPLVYIYDLAVATAWQRRGVGRTLIEAINSHCRELGVEAVMVEADETDGHAIDFYRSTGAVGLKTVHFDYLLKEKDDY